MKDDCIKDHLHLWRVLRRAAKKKYPTACFADIEDAASYSYCSFVAKYNERSNQWTSRFAYVFGKYRAISYFNKLLLEYNKRKIHGAAVESDLREKPIGMGKPLAAKCLSQIADLMEAKANQRYKNKKNATSKVDYHSVLDEMASADIIKRKSGDKYLRPTSKAAKRLGVHKQAINHRMDLIKQNDEALLTWNNHKINEI